MSEQEKKADLDQEKSLVEIEAQEEDTHEDPASPAYFQIMEFLKEKTKRPKKLPLFLNLTVRLSSFLFLFLVLLSVFFLIGNNQSFLDENLVLILNFMAASSIALAIFSLAGLISAVYYIFSKKNVWYLVAIILFLVLIVVSAVMCAASLSVTVISGGL